MEFCRSIGILPGPIPHQEIGPADSVASILILMMFGGYSKVGAIREKAIREGNLKRLGPV